MSNSLRPHESQHARPPCPSLTPRVHSNSCPSSWWCHPAISSFVIPSPPALNLSQHQGLSQWVSSAHQVAKVLEFQLHQSFQWTPRTERILAYLWLSYSRSYWKLILSTVPSNFLAQTLISSTSSLPSWSSPLLPLTRIIAVAFYHNFLFFFFSLYQILFYITVFDFYSAWERKALGF